MSKYVDRLGFSYGRQEGPDVDWLSAHRVASVTPPASFEEHPDPFMAQKEKNVGVRPGLSLPHFAQQVTARLHLMDNVRFNEQVKCLVHYSEYDAELFFQPEPWAWLEVPVSN